MSDILNDFSISALIHAVKANLYEFFRYLGRSRQTELFSSAALIRWHTTTPHPWFNGVLSTRPASDIDRHTVQDVIAYFQSRSVSRFTWWLDPALTRADWDDLLRPHGFRYDDRTPGLAADLQRLNPAGAVPPNLRITRVSDPDTLKEWTHTFITGYQLPATWESGLLGLMTGIGLEWPVRNYLGYLDGKPVTTSSVFLGAGVAGVQFVATLPEARRQGLGAAMTLAPLHEVQEMGYRIGILQSSAVGLKLYKQLGFQHVCQMEHFYWASQISTS